MWDKVNNWLEDFDVDIEDKNKFTDWKTGFSNIEFKDDSFN